VKKIPPGEAYITDIDSEHRRFQDRPAVGPIVQPRLHRCALNLFRVHLFAGRVDDLRSNRVSKQVTSALILSVVSSWHGTSAGKQVTGVPDSPSATARMEGSFRKIERNAREHAEYLVNS
jgi:hypothetical protein